MLSQTAMGFAGRVKDHPPLWRRTMRSWSPEEREEFEERAAIRTYLGKQPLEEAEKGAWDDVTSRTASAALPPIDFKA